MEDEILEDIDPARVDLYICYPCSMEARHSACHEWRNIEVKGHWPAHNQSVTWGVQLDLFAYVSRVMLADVEDSIGSFVRRCTFEVQSGIRNHPNGPFIDGLILPSLENVSIRTDGTDRPTLQVEIEEWLSEVRAEYEFPSIALGIPYYGTHTLDNCMTQLEVFLFCTFLNSKTLGAGNQFYGGRLTEGLPFTEKELADEGWRNNAKKRNNG